MRDRVRPIVVGAVVAVVAAASIAALRQNAITWHKGSRRHTIDVVARRYGFDPPVIRVSRGDELRLRFASLDVVHGFYLEGYDIDVAIEPLRNEVQMRRALGPLETVSEVVLTAARAGKFRFRCSKTCGSMHPFMAGELIVEPNWLLPASSAVALGLLAGFVAAWWSTGRGASA